MNTTRLKKKLSFWIYSLQNFFIKDESIIESKKKWSQLAEQDPKGYVVTNKAISENEESFRISGKQAYKKYVADDQILQKKLQDINAGSVLDVGCGVGRITEFFGNDFQKVYGTDIAPKMVEVAKSRLMDSRFEFIETDGLRLPFENKSIDFAFSFATFQHMPNIKAVMENFLEVQRVLKSRGIFKVQLRGAPVFKKSWYYGVNFNKSKAFELAQDCGFDVIYIQSESDRNLWLLLEKK